MTSEARRIAAGLTEAQRLFVACGTPDDLIAGGYALGALGLAQLDNRTTPHRFYLLPLGLEVRRILMEST